MLIIDKRAPHTNRRLLSVGLAVWVVCVLGLGVFLPRAAAHPLGNYSINQYLLLNLRGSVPEIYYLLDMAEIPSFPEPDLIDTDFDSIVTDTEENTYLNTRVPPLVEKIRFTLSGRPVPLEVSDRRLSLQEGSGGMIVINVLVKLIPSMWTWTLEPFPVDLEIVSENYLDNSGVRECKIYLGKRFTDQTKRLGRAAELLVEHRIGCDYYHHRYRTVHAPVQALPVDPSQPARCPPPGAPPPAGSQSP